MIRSAAVLFLLLQASAASADSWAPPSKRTFRSPDKAARLTVRPRALQSPLAYFEDKVEGREPAGAPPGITAATASATMERRSPSGRWRKAWTRPLDNEVAPVEVVVAAGGRAFATLDNWHSTGYGPNVVVVYDGEGGVVRRFGLTDLFPEWFVAAFPRSISSIRWRRQPRISADGRELIVPVLQPRVDRSVPGDEPTLDLAIRLSDGAPVGLERPEWKQALVAAAAVAREGCRIQHASTRAWNGPISAPTAWKEEDWHHYLRETQYRTRWSNPPPAPATTVLRPAGAADAEASVRWLEEALTRESGGGDLRVIGSPDMAALAAQVERIAAGIRPGQLEGVDLVIVAEGAHSERIRGALGRSGAALEIIDPLRSIPQIEQRMHKEGAFAICGGP